MSDALFKTKAVKIDTLGEYLQQVREQLNLDVKTVSILAQIKPNYLELLEKGAFDQLPAEVYIRGFLKSLANFYHIKEDILIDQYEKERGFETSVVPSKYKATNWLSLTPRTLIVGASIFFLLAAVTYVGIEIRSVLVPPFLELSEPLSDITISGSSIVVSGRSEVGAEVFINNQPVLTDRNGQFSETLLLSAGINIIEVSGKNKFDKVSKIQRQITSTAVEETPLPAQAVNLEIAIGPNSAWVNIESDGVVVQRGTMLPGSSKIFSAKDQIVMTSANAGSTKIIYNGKDLGQMGREGEVIRNVEFSTPSQQ